MSSLLHPIPTYGARVWGKRNGVPRETGPRDRAGKRERSGSAEAPALYQLRGCAGDAMAGPRLLVSAEGPDGWSAPGPALPEDNYSPDGGPPGAFRDNFPQLNWLLLRLIEGARETELKSFH